MCMGVSSNVEGLWFYPRTSWSLLEAVVAQSALNESII